MITNLSFDVVKLALHEGKMLFCHLGFEDAGLVGRPVGCRECERIRLPECPKKVKRDEAIVKQRVETGKLLACGDHKY